MKVRYKERTIYGCAVLALVSQADALVGNKVCALIVNDTGVDNSQLVTDVSKE
jgi:non-ribosomal peptide synthetase component E (peptide arylation enzyme)